MDAGLQEISHVEHGQAERQGMGEKAHSLPSGTVTFLFTDIEGSTQLLYLLGDRFTAVLAEHHRILREAITHGGGQVVRTEGDAFFVAFPSARQAVSAAVEAQLCLVEYSWPEGASIRVRMGLHTGEAEVALDDYVGLDVHRAARIAHVGHGGQVLLSQTTRDLVYQNLPPGSRLRDLGAHMLKDMRYPQEIYQLEIPGLPGEFPPLKSLDKLEKEEEPPAPGKSPYMGLQYFDEEDAEWFFGRQAVTDRLVEAACSQRFLAVIGASGSGKSSVVRAGLVPAMKTRERPHWQVNVITPSSHPLEALATCLTRESESVTATATLIDDMQSNPRSLHLYCQKNLFHDKDTRPLLVIDQFEELFTLCRSEAERLAFVKNFLYAVGIPDGALTGVITLRADFYGHLAQYAGLRELVSAHQVYIGAMNASELRAAIEEPAKRGSWEIFPGLVDLILSDLGVRANRQPEPGALPLLSHALLETWKRRRGNLMNLKAYTEAGGVRGAIAKTAESVFHRELTPDQQVIAKGVFLRLTELGEGTQDTRRRISIRELIPPGPAIEAEQIQAVLGKLADARLIITGEETVEVAHEALIREWPTLREWLASDRESLRLHRHLTEATQDWEMLARDSGGLYRGTRLNQALEWAMANPRELNAEEQAFLEASREAAEREQSEREAQRQRELEAAQKLAEAERQRAEEQGRSARRLRRRAWLLGGVLVLALILASAAVGFWQQADLKEREALSRYLASVAEKTLMLDSQLSAHLALQAIKADPTYNRAESALHQVLPELHLVSSTSVTPGYWTGWLIRDGELLINVTPEGIEVVDQVAGRRSMLAQGGNCNWVIPTEEGRWLIANCQKEEQQVWEIETQKLLFTLPNPGLALGTMGIIAPSPTHSLLAFVGYEDMTVHVWEVFTGKELFVFTGHVPTPGIRGADLIASQDGKLLATYGYDPMVILWDGETGEKLLQFDAQSKGIGSAGFSPDGTHLATWGQDGTIKIWNLTSSTGPALERTIPHEKDMMNVIYSPLGTRLAAGGIDGRVKVWDAQTGELQMTLSGHTGTTLVLSFSQDDSRLYTGSPDGTIKEWDLSLSKELLTLTGRMIGNAPFSPDGSKMAVSKADGSLAVVDSQTGAELQSWQAHSDWMTDIAWSPDGEWLATSNGDSQWVGFQFPIGDRSLKIWDISTGQLIKEIPGEEYGGFSQVTWSPDGNLLATASITGTSIIWDPYTWDPIITHTLQGSTQASTMWSIAFSPDGQKIAAGSQTSIYVWDVISGSEVFTQTLNHTPIGMAFSPDGQRLAISRSDGILLLKMIDGGAVQERILSGGDQAFFAVDISPDGALLAAGDVKGTVRVWDLKTMQIRFEVATFPDPVLRVAFSPDSRRLVASDSSGTTFVYVLPLDELIELVSSRIVLPMKEEECWEYLQTETCPPWP